MARRRIGIVRSMLQAMLSPVATALSGFVGSGYNVTDPRRKVIDRNQMFANKSTANQLLSGSLSQMRTYCRHLERNNPTAKAGVVALQSLIVGSGIALEYDAGDDATKAQVRQLFGEWMASVCVDGRDIYQLQNLAVHELPTAGEWLWRIVPDDSATPGPIPLRVLPLEGEWLNDVEAAAPSNGCTMVAGVELDKYGRPVAYFLSPPEFGAPEKVKAASVIHGFERLRPLQARGEPWLAPVIETLMNERDLVDAELKAAVITANIGIAIESEMHAGLNSGDDENEDANDPVQSLGLGSVVRLYPGETVNAFHHTRPSQQIAPFRQMLRGDIAAALRIPQRFLDRDVSRANYSSMRADMLDTQRLLAPVREWVGHQTIGRLFQIAAPFLSAKIGIPIDPCKYRLLPDGQPYVDPEKDIRAASMAIAAGLSTFEQEIAARGGDYRQVWKQLKKEQDEAESLGIKIDLSGTNAPAPQSSLGSVTTTTGVSVDEDDEDEEEEDDAKDDGEAAMSPEDQARMARMERMMEGMIVARSAQPPPAPPVTVEQRISMDENTAQRMGEAIGRSIPAQVVNVPPAQITVAPAAVTVEAARVDVPAAQVVVNVPQQAAPTVNISPTPVTVENKVEVQQRPVRVTPDGKGGAIMTPQE